MKMDNKQIKKLYMEHVERSTPDMDALWEKIESGLESKPENGVTSKPVRKRMSFGSPALKWAVCAAALLIVPISVRIINNSSISKDLASNTAHNQAINADGGLKDGGAYENAEAELPADDYFAVNDEDFVPDNTPTEVPSDAVVNRKVVFYEELFSDYSSITIAAPKADTSGDDFFVEDKVLVETDVIVNACIDRVYSKGDTVCYEITAENVETLESETLVIESATPYIMQPDRSYLLPLKAENGEYRLVFENAPQIEFTEDGGLVFHNGWVTLDALKDDPITVIYPQNGIDDFFYDRMKFSYNADITPLLDEWHRLRQTE